MTGQRSASEVGQLREELPPLVRFLNEEAGPPSGREKSSPFKWKSAPVDWSPYRPPVRHQGIHQTCTGHATATMVEAVRRSTGDDGATLSPSYVHACIGGVDPDQGLDPLRLLRHLGAGRKVAPYAGPDPWPRTQCAIGSGVTLARLREVRGDDDARLALATSPVVAALEIGDEFLNLSQHRYEPIGPTPGHHTVCILAQTSYGWLVQNSFGPGWGASGGLFEIARGVGGLLRPGYSAVALRVQQ
jgi:hypothetical protein